MGYIKYLRGSRSTEQGTAARRERLLKIRREPATTRLERPTKMDRARSLGYRAKQGIVVVRQRVLRGGHTRADIKSGRRPSRNYQRKVLRKNYQQIAEERVGQQYLNCEVLGSYLLDKDGKHAWYEVILVDRVHPAVLADSRLLGIAAQRGRAPRGLTAAGRKGRGLLRKGQGAEKIRPSRRARERRS